MGHYSQTQNSLFVSIDPAHQVGHFFHIQFLLQHLSQTRSNRRYIHHEVKQSLLNSCCIYPQTSSSQIAQILRAARQHCKAFPLFTSTVLHKFSSAFSPPSSQAAAIIINREAKTNQKVNPNAKDSTMAFEDTTEEKESQGI